MSALHGNTPRKPAAPKQMSEHSVGAHNYIRCRIEGRGKAAQLSASPSNEECVGMQACGDVMIMIGQHGRSVHEFIPAYLWGRGDSHFSSCFIIIT